MHTSYTTSDSAAAVSFPPGGAGGPVLCTWEELGGGGRWRGQEVAPRWDASRSWMMGVERKDRSGKAPSISPLE